MVRGFMDVVACIWDDGFEGKMLIAVIMFILAALTVVTVEILS